MKTINLEIITPERIAFSDEVSQIEALTVNGWIGILPGHIPLFTKLIEGEVIITNKGEKNFLAIGSGFLEIARDKAVILVTSAYHSHELNESEVVEAKKRAEQILAQKPTGEALIAARLQFQRSQIALKVIHRKRKPFSTVS